MNATTNGPLRAYFGDPALKAEFLARMDAHIAADQLAQGAIGQDGRGCAVWCTYDEYDHRLGPERLGVPAWYERLRDGIFEGLPADEAPAWALASLAEVPVGADVESIRRPFLTRLLSRSFAALPPDDERVRAAVQGVIGWLEADEPETGRESVAAAAQAAAQAAAAQVAEAAAWAAAEAEEAAAEAAAAAAWATAEAVWATAEAGLAARHRERRAQREDLIALLRGLAA